MMNTRFADRFRCRKPLIFKIWSPANVISEQTAIQLPAFQFEKDFFQKGKNERGLSLNAFDKAEGGWLFRNR